MIKKKQKCYIYTRVSVALQVDGNSLDLHKDELRKYAEYQKIRLPVSIRTREPYRGPALTEGCGTTFAFWQVVDTILLFDRSWRFLAFS